MYRMSYDGDYSRAWIGKAGYVIQQKMELSWEFDIITLILSINPDITNSDYITNAGEIHE